MDSDAPRNWRELLRPKAGWFVAGGLALLGVLVMDRLIPSTPEWLQLTWGFTLLSTGLLFDSVRDSRWGVRGAIAIYVLLIAVSAYLLFDRIAQRMPISVQAITNFGVYSPNPRRDPRARLEDATSPLYLSDVFIISNNTNETITFQALLKIEGDLNDEILAATLAFGDRQGWSNELKAFFDALLHSDQIYLLSPVTIGPNATVRGRFPFPIPVYIYADGYKEKLALWSAALDPVKPLEGSAYIDLRDFSSGRRLADPIYLLGKGKVAK